MGFFDSTIRSLGRVVGYDNGRYNVKGMLDPFGTVEGSKNIVAHKILHLPTSAEIRQQKAAIQGQIDLSNQASNLAMKQLNETKRQQDIEKGKIQGKQMRSLKRKNSRSGFLGNTSDLNTTLGS